MKKIYATLCLLLSFFAVLQAQPTFYALTTAKTNFISNYTGSTNTLSAVITAQSSEERPMGDLVKARNGKLYGMTRSGGSSDDGVIFSFDPSSGTYTKLKDFGGTLGSDPLGSLMQASDDKLYGMTSDGGSSNAGVIFSFDPSSGIYTKLKDFGGADGSNPRGSLMQASDGRLYGMTRWGGSENRGVIFSFDPSRGTYTKLKDFTVSKDFTVNGGYFPFGSLMQASNGKLYGMTNSGGVLNRGVIFSFDPVTEAYTKVKEFLGPDGSDPEGSLIQASNGLLYGMTPYGGKNVAGVIFALDPSSGNFHGISFPGDANGGRPTGSLMQASNGKLYGLTAAGTYGVIFSFDPSSGTYTNLKSFGGTEGVSPAGSLVQASNGKLYGMTQYGGISSVGVIFSLDPSSGVYTKLKDFIGKDGSAPRGSLVKARDGKLYGMTLSGGKYGGGIIFCFDPASGAYTKPKDFGWRDSDGKSPHGSLVLAGNGKLYGMTAGGGDWGHGTIFSFDPSSSIFTKLKDFGFGGADGSDPRGSLFRANTGKLYGMTSSGGSNNKGVIFSFDPATNAYTKLKDFGGADGATPIGDLAQASFGTLYGMTSRGGSSDRGVIFSFNPSTGVYKKLKDFGGSEGAAPLGSLVLSKNGGRFYGMTSSGGSYNYGVIFEINHFSVTPYKKLYDLGGTKGQGVNPFGSLVQARDAKLYGTTANGGSRNLGVIFSFDPSSNTYTELNNFDGTNGSHPVGSLLEVGSTPTTISTASLNSSYCAGSSVTVNYTASGAFASGNVFTAQLSDTSGSFTSTKTPPTTIGTVTATTSGAITATIPAGASAGSKYRIRVVASNPVITGSDNGNNIAVKALATYYRDADGDKYGDAKKPTQACSAADGYVSDNTDCDDTKASVHPGATEVCNGIDDNCNGLIDEGVKKTFYADADGDKYGDAKKPMQACSVLSGYVTDNTDCDDTKASVHPGATEVCNGIDDNCNGIIDEGVLKTFYADADRDGYGDTKMAGFACSAPDGYVSNNTDCDDTKASINPGKTEVCANGIDDNCNGLIDENCGSVPRISINDVTVYESDGVAVLTVSSDRVSTSDIKIHYDTENGTASGSGKGAKRFDFELAKGSVTIDAGTKTAQIRITITTDAVVEPGEYFEVSIGLKGNDSKDATIIKNSAIVTIRSGTRPTLTSNYSAKAVQPAGKAVRSLALDAQAYPNPSTSSFNISMSNNNTKERIAMTVTDVNGRVIERRNNLTAGQTVQTGSQYRPGIYFVEMTQGKARVHLKLVKVMY